MDAALTGIARRLGLEHSSYHEDHDTLVNPTRDQMIDQCATRSGWSRQRAEEWLGNALPPA